MNTLTLTEAIENLKNKSFSSVELTNACISRIQNTDSKLNAVITLIKEQAIENAEKSDVKRSKGIDLPLLGIPYVLKDNFSTQNIRTTASSNVLANFIPPYNATVVQKLEDAGAILIGKTNLDAWAHGSSTETSDFGPTKNPWNVGYLPGGSSGGSAASIAANQAIFAIGSETAGSIRQPASWCGVVGLKPTYGRVSRFGVVAMASSLDSPGPLTKTVKDAALVLKVIAGHDPKDATSSPLLVPDYANNLQNKKKMTIGVSEDYFNSVDSQVANAVYKAIEEFEKKGMLIKKIKLFDPKYAISDYTIIQRAEVSSNLARYDGIRYGNGRDMFGEEAKRRIMLGTFTLSSGYYDAYYNKAVKVRTEIINDFNKAFSEVDAIVAPTAPTAALPLGATKENSMFGELADVLVEPSSIAGLSGINVTCGFTSLGLPIGMQIIGPQFKEEVVLQLAHLFEQNTLFHKQQAKL